MIKQQILDILKKHQRFLIAAHVHPEGDAIGSQLAMAHLLKQMGKTVRIVNADAVPHNLCFLPDAALIENCRAVEPQALTFDAALILDCPVLERVGAVQALLKDALIVNIDHHISNNEFGAVNWVDPKASSAGEMIYALFKSGAIPLDQASALYLYVAIMTDTGSFHYSNTTSATHHIAAELLSHGINPTKIYENIYETKSFDTMKLLAEVLSGLKRSRDGKYVWFKVTLEMLKKNNLTEESTEDFIDFVRMVEGAEVVAFLREMRSREVVKVSLRSKSEVDVNAIAKHFGGGGHYAASGCVIEKTIDEAEKLLVRRIRAAMPKD
jgi:Exopolyphosphatase-related proteins